MPLLQPPPPPFGTRTREPSPVDQPVPGSSLQQPKCLLEYERFKHLHNGNVGNNSNIENSNMVNGVGGQQFGRPDTLDKLSTYRRMRSLTQQESGGGSGSIRVIPTNGVDCSSSQSRMIDVEMEKKKEPDNLPQLPKEVAKYILDMEEQNRFLRQNVIKLQEEFKQQQIQADERKQLADIVVSNTQRVISGGDRNGVNDLLVASGAFVSQEERERYMNDVLAQVDVIVQAHRNKSEAEILRYKEEAETAKLALKQLREAIALEGVDLSMLPAAMAALSGRPLNVGKGINMVKSNKNNIQSRENGEGEEDEEEKEGIMVEDNNAIISSKISTKTMMGGDLSGITKIMLEKCKPLLTEASDAVLADLLRVEADDDVPTIVRESVRRGFEGLAQHLASLVADYVGHYINEVRYLQQEREAARRELREELNASEHQRLRMAQRYETEIRALRDELHAFHVAAAEGDELRATVHERALAEYTRLLAESRDEATSLRSQLEEARSDHATMCLRLKASLERRGAEFEAAVIKRAADVLKQRDHRIAELERCVRQQQQAEERRRSGRVMKGVQVEMEDVMRDGLVLDESHFVPNLLAVCSNGKKKNSRVSGLNQSFVTSPFSTKQHRGKGLETSAVMSATSGVGLPSARPSIVHSVQSESESALQHEESFEEEVWEKTMELLTKYGNIAKH
ncbi:uncharacterized protein TM35_000221580 [Trypanosoma theileri]|uniref:Uncharacterized protein n=1 Tax=Trypanosoma theileri TaxID=67003 RepID=A0A1X0NT45_9TRYP|nr:uncharacterized protein TM35_000221580 [Trypanosoma theileri]ORC87359.1 hypothetical protein TM35_000221580 [Trypanosoma theileri]